ncbi:MAG: DUF4258 domain-containing protein [Deltaproteobacteria bacterium]|jgi:hypothetical protein
MDPEGALRAIRGLAKANRIRLTAHADREAAECGATRGDIRRALVNAKGIRASGLGRASDWTVAGPDLDGDDLELALIIEDGLLIITVY